MMSHKNALDSLFVRSVLKGGGVIAQDEVEKKIDEMKPAKPLFNN
jgi:hypothetical protein